LDKVKQLNQLRKEFQYGKCLKYLETKKGKNVVLHSFIRDIFRTIQLGQSSVISLILSY
jgi:aminoglycoside N3'-acetyltransferase